MVTGTDAVGPLLSEAHLRQVMAQAAAAWPMEACGLFVGSDESSVRLVSLPNVMDAWHARDPVAWPRTARDGYALDSMQVLSEAEAGGGLCAVWHSHPAGGTALSAEDLRVALAGGPAPSWPGVAQLVVACPDGRVTGGALHRWDEEAGRYLGRPIPLPRRDGEE